MIRNLDINFDRKVSVYPNRCIANCFNITQDLFLDVTVNRMDISVGYAQWSEGFMVRHYFFSRDGEPIYDPAIEYMGRPADRYFITATFNSIEYMRVVRDSIEKAESDGLDTVSIEDYTRSFSVVNDYMLYEKYAQYSSMEELHNMISSDRLILKGYKQIGDNIYTTKGEQNDKV